MQAVLHLLLGAGVAAVYAYVWLINSTKTVSQQQSLFQPAES